MVSKVTVEIPHSELGPSAAERWLECPGSVLLVRGMDDPESWYAAEGTAAHTLSEWCREEGKSAAHWLGTTIVVGKHEFIVDKEFVEAVDSFVEYVSQWPGEGVYEERVHYEEYVPGGFGTMDDARLTDGVCRVTDLKYGKGVQVFAAKNPQLRLYALGLYLAYRHLYRFDKFILTIVQPRLDHIDEDTIDLADLLVWAEAYVRPIAKLALTPGAPLKAGSHCTFCPARRVCKVRAEYVAKAALSDFEDLDSPVRSALLTNDEIAQVLPKLADIKKWCNDIQAHACAEIARGNPVGDWKLVEGISRRVLNCSPEEAAEKLALDVDDPAELWERKFVGVGKLEKLVGKKRAADVLFKPEGKPVLAPGSDPRPSVKVDPTQEFAALEDE